MQRAWFALLASAVVATILLGGSVPTPGVASLSSTYHHAPAPNSSSAATVTTPGVPSLPTTAGGNPPELSGPGGLYSIRAWSGLDSSASCSTACPAPDPSVATDGNYVVEASGQAYRVWTSNETQVDNASLATLLTAGTDVISDPAVVYDSTTLRWFLAADDLSLNEVVFAISATGDPTAGWRVHHFPAPPAGDALAAPKLAVDSTAVVTTSLVERGGSFIGSEIEVANKSDLVGGTTISTWSSGVDAFWGPLVPATPVAASSELYLATDGFGGGPFQLLEVSGTPPTTPVVTTAASFSTALLNPPNATQPGSSDLLSSGDGRVASAVWDGSDLWAAADVACTPLGDLVPRACLHLWEVATANDSLVQQFNWSSGAGTYDLDPALATDERQNLVVVFDESSSSVYPSVEATGRTGADSLGALESPIVLKAGGEPDRATSCAAGVCAFGNYSAAVLAPFHNRTFWVIGEYFRNNTVVDPWHTWLDRLMSVDGFPVTLTESGLPAGTPWNATINGANYASNSSTITAFESAGAYSYSVPEPIPGPPGVRYVATPESGSFSVVNASVNVSVTYAQQFSVSGVAAPAGAGTVAPELGWYARGSVVNWSAVPALGYLFDAWQGNGTGAYSGPANPTLVTVEAPVVEVAQFYALGIYSVTVHESGLPAGTSWSVVVNGVVQEGTQPSIVFEEPNGSYSFAATTYVPGPPGLRYTGTDLVGLLNVSGSSIQLNVSYFAEYSLSVTADPAGAGWVSPATGWYPAGARETLAAFGGPSSAFSSWTGVGNGSYSGGEDPANVTVNGPTTEVAEFVAATVYPVVFCPSGLSSGTDWAVTVNGLGENTSAANLTFYEPNGSYSYASGILVTGGPVGPYSIDPLAGNFTVAGRAVNESLVFSLGATAGPPGGTSVWVPILLTGAAVLLGIALVGVAVALRRAHRESHSLVIVTVPGAVPPPWDEGPLSRPK